MNKNVTVLLLVLAAGSIGMPQEAYAQPMDPNRKVSEQDCSRPVDSSDGNLMCREVTDAERRARIAEEERQARARKEAEERAARERLERERAEQLALEEAARKAQAAEEERLAAERRLLEAEAALYSRTSSPPTARSRNSRRSRDRSPRSSTRLAR